MTAGVCRSFMTPHHLWHLGLLRSLMVSPQQPSWKAAVVIIIRDDTQVQRGSQPHVGLEQMHLLVPKCVLPLPALGFSHGLASSEGDSNVMLLTPE